MCLFFCIVCRWLTPNGIQVQNRKTLFGNIRDRRGAGWRRNRRGDAVNTGKKAHSQRKKEKSTKHRKSTFKNAMQKGRKHGTVATTKKRRMRAAQHRRGGKMITRAWQCEGLPFAAFILPRWGMEGKRQRAGRVRRQSHRQGAPLPLRAAAGGRLPCPASRRPACIRDRGAFIDRRKIDASMENFRYKAAKQAGTGRGISKIF